MAQAKKTAGKTAQVTSSEVVGPEAFKALSRGQKAALTRRNNAAKRAALHAVKVKNAKADVKAKVPTKAERAKNLSRLKKEQAARDKRKAELKAKREAHAAGKEKAENDKRTKGVAAIRKVGLKASDTGTLGLLRHTAVLAATKGKRSAYDYAAGLNATFTPDWVNWKDAEGKLDTNHGKTVAAFLTEKKAYYEDFRANFDGVGDCNPSAYWANIKKYALNLVANGAAKKRGAGSAIDAEAALKRDLPKLYLRANNQKGASKDPKLQEASRLLGLAITALGLNLAVINEKIDEKE